MSNIRVMVTGSATDRLELLAALAATNESIVLVNRDTIEIRQMTAHEDIVLPIPEGTTTYNVIGTQKRLHKQKGRNRRKW